ncbi:MAG TPA: tetratricopeptide repeat protein [Blastocatellia bacterium]|nr:tetratricopeptide repeat protein [Blastocatellia bacterium]
MNFRAYKVIPLLALILMLGKAASAQEWDRAVSLYNQKQYRPAIREFHAVLKANPDAWQSWFYIGASHFQLQSYQDCIDAFGNYIKSSAKDEKGQGSGHYYIGMSYYQMKQYDKAIVPLKTYLSIYEKIHEKVDPVSRAALGRAYIFTEKFAEAIPVLTAAAAAPEMKTNSTNFYYIGFAQQKLGRLDLAIPALNQALAVDPKDVDSLSLLADIYLKQVKQNPAALKQAITTGEKLLQVKNDEHSWALLGQAYLMDQQWAKAAPLLEKYARAHMDSSGAWYNFGLALSRSSQWKPAADALEQAVKLAPTNLATLLELGYVYESDKQYDKALSAYERAFDASGKKDQTAKAGIDRVKQSKS